VGQELGTGPRRRKKRRGKRQAAGGRETGPTPREVRERVNPFSFLFSHLFLKPNKRILKPF